MFKPPIRTYQRKNCAKTAIHTYQPVRNNCDTELYGLQHHDLTQNGNQHKGNDNSLDYDPFETTFDRIAKDAVVPPMPPDAENHSSLSSSFDSSRERTMDPIPIIPAVIMETEVKVRPKRKKQQQIKTLQTSMKKLIKPGSATKRKGKIKRRKMDKSDVTKEVKSQKRNKKKAVKTDILQANDMKLQESDANESTSKNRNEFYEHKDQLINFNDNPVADRGKHNVKEQCPETPCLSVIDLCCSIKSANNSSEVLHAKDKQPCVKSDISCKELFVSLRDVLAENETKYHMKNITERIAKETGNNVTLDMSLMNADVPHLIETFDQSKIQPCSVKLDKDSVERWKAKDKSIQHSNMLRKCTVNLTRMNEHSGSINKGNEQNSVKDNLAKKIKGCYINLHHLTNSISTKDSALQGNIENFVCSTPMGKVTKPLISVNFLSPIVIKNTEKLVVNKEEEESLNDIGEENNIAPSFNHSDKSSTWSVKESNVSNTISKNRGELSSLELKNDKVESMNNVELNQYLQTNTCFKPGEEPEFHDKASYMEISIKNNKLPVHSFHSELQCHRNCNEKNKILPCLLTLAEGSDPSLSLFDDTEEYNTMQDTERHSKSTSDIASLLHEMNTDGMESANMETGASIDNVCQNSATLPDTINEESRNKIQENSSKNNELILNSKDDICKTSDEDIDIENMQEIQGHEDAVESIQEARLSNTVNENSLINTIQESFEANRLSVLTKLQDPVKITNRRRRYQKWNLKLDDVLEDDSSDGHKILQYDERICSNITIDAKKSRQCETLTDVHNSLHCDKLEDDSIKNISQPPQKPVFLKPGKYWARSLSILSNVQCGFNIDELSIGKGKKWRHSVKTILEMQKQGVIQSCVKNVDNEKDLQPYYNIPHQGSQPALTSNRCSTLEPGSTNHFSRRVSIRVVPDNKTSQCVDDVLFLEAYGIGSQNLDPSATLLRSQRDTDSNVDSNDNSAQDTESQPALVARQVVLQRCTQEDYIPFTKCFPDSYLQHCRKIGEGVYGEVFLYECGKQKSVIKIIPIEGEQLVNGEAQKKFEEILSEIVIAKELHSLRFSTTYNTNGFVEVKNVRCVVGQYPNKLVELWKNFDEDKSSDNDCPSMFDENQLYIVLELGHGGQDLEAFVFNTAAEALSVFIQAALALAVAEESLEFEHRDLHWGNVLISRTNDSFISYKLDNKEVRLPSNGVKVSIIDFTLSRMSYQGCSVFNDLALDPALFTAEGEYQFEIYRLMRDKVRNNWQEFEPYTNVLWLHYTLDKMITAVRYKRRNLKIHKNAIAELEELKSVVLEFQSSFDFVTSCDKITNLLCNN